MKPLESAPRDGRWILIYRAGLYPAWIVGLWWEPRVSIRGARWVDQCYSEIRGGTHWAPLPEEPT